VTPEGTQDRDAQPDPSNPDPPRYAVTSTAVIDARDARLCLLAAAARTAELIESLAMDPPVSGSEWTVGDTAAHLIFALRGFTSSALGDYAEWFEWEAMIPNTRTPVRVEVLNRTLLAVEPRGSAAEMAAWITKGAEAFVAASASLHPDQAMPTPWYGPDETLTVAEATCLLLGEQVVHGYDVATAAGRKWPISKQDALLIFQAVRAMMPKIADPAGIGDVNATYELHLGRADRFVVRIADGAALVEPVAGQRIDCHLLADPVTLMLLGYGRISQWNAIGRMKLIAWGTKPWMAFRFVSFFSNP
jgi:uncharacterized protein (TIGR03083 family)